MKITTFVSSNITIPSSVDWRKEGAVTDIKKQKKCGSCWAFAATGAVEAQHFRKTGKLISLSEQNLIDCSYDFGNRGCHGGSRWKAYKYIKKNGGIDTEKSYPYKAKLGKCEYNDKKSGATISGMSKITKGNEKDLTVAIANIGPISVGIDSSHKSFHFYKSGIYHEPKCNSVSLHHAVLVVGYGSDNNGNDYYIVKNSWGKTWGMKGYIKMSRNRNNNCGIATRADYPIV